MSEVAVPNSPHDDPRRPTNRLALPALVATILLCFPVGAVLGVVSLVQIRRSRGAEDGALFAAMAVLVSAVLAPAVVVSALYGTPRMLDSCFYTQEEAVGVLRVISYLEDNFHKEHGRYGALEEIGFAPKVDVGPYLFAVERHEKDRFLASAKGTKHMEGDLLTVSESHQVERTRDRCQILRERRER